MENIKDLINQLENEICEFMKNEYIAGMQGEPPIPISLPLPPDDKLLAFVLQFYRDLEQAYESGQKREPYKLPFSDKYITSIGLIEKSLQ